MENTAKSLSVSTLYVMETAAYAYAADRWQSVLTAMKTRDQFPISSLGWLTHNDLVATARADARQATARAENITDQIRTAPGPLLTDGWACTACGWPVEEISPGTWQHKIIRGDCPPAMLGLPLQARVDA